MEKKEEQNLLVQISNVEKRLWATIHAKGLLHHDVQNLYQKLCSSYEKILIGDHELTQLQDVEYSLWKIHYNQIDEFRKILKKSSVGEMTKKHQKLAVTQGSIEDYAKGLKSFRAEATKFYQRLVVEIRRRYGLPEDFSFYGSDGTSASIEPKRMEKLQILSHRFLICLGDLARYKEQCEKDDAESRDWSVAVSYYLEASAIWPHSGGPQNQLAVLATYVGDEFLALYHCLRSLAAKEPFPDAWNNLILLFERNRSANLNSLLIDAHFDPLNPHENFVQMESSSDNGLSETERDKFVEESLWPLLIRLISFFFTDCSFEEFPTTFASTVKQLDVLLSLDDAKLKAALEPYQRIDSARTGPYRALHVVSIFIFASDRLTRDAEMDEAKKKGDAKGTVLLEKALTPLFIFMGRIAYRCLKAKVLHTCPLLPALLVFVEWLPSILDEAETDESDEKSKSVMSYFFSYFLDLLKQLEVNREGEEPSRSIALWEDYELRGFQPLAHSHLSLDFPSHLNHADSYENGACYRTCRIINAAMKIADRSCRIGKWIQYDKFARKFYAGDSTNKKQSDKVETIGSMSELKESGQSNSIQASHESLEEDAAVTKDPSNHPSLKSGSVDEEEVILFNPLTRHNSAPVSSILSDDRTLQTNTDEQTLPADECLRRATSLLIAQNQGSQQDSSAFQYDLTNFRHSEAGKHQESTAASISPSSAISAGPPSLNAWVLDRGNVSNDTTKASNKVSRQMLTPINEIAPSFSNLSISETRDPIATHGSEASTTRYSSPAYAAPVPSAPSLPDNASWLNSIQSNSSYNNSSGMINATQASSYSNWSGSHEACNPTIPTFTDTYLLSRPLTSSEWLCQYRQNHKHQHTVSHIWPIHPATESNGNFYVNDISRTGLFDQWGASLVSNPLIYEQYPTMHRVYPPVTDDGYNRLSPYEEVKDPRPLAHFLKEREWLLQQNPALRGPTYMGR